MCYTKMYISVLAYVYIQEKGGFSRVWLPACLIPSVYLLIRVLRKLSMIVCNGGVEVIRDTELGVCNGNVQAT